DVRALLLGDGKVSTLAGRRALPFEGDSVPPVGLRPLLPADRRARWSRPADGGPGPEMSWIGMLDSLEKWSFVAARAHWTGAGAAADARFTKTRKQLASDSGRYRAGSAEQ